MKKLTLILSLLISFMSVAVFAFPNKEKIDNIELVAGLIKPPFIIEEKGKGLQLDLIREAFKLSDIAVEFTHMPLGRNITGFRRYNADGVITVPPEYKYPNIFVSEPYITYQNVAVSLAENDFTINSVRDLSDKSIIAFQNAHKFLGREYKENVSNLIEYREIANQLTQIELFFLRRAEVIVLDLNIFKFFVKSHNEAIFNKQYKIHYIFNERPYSVGFKSEKLKNIFDQNINTLKDIGRYQLIFDEYLH